MQGVFFLATSLMGSCSTPWWDHITFMVKTARRRRFALRYPADLTIDLEGNGMTRSLLDILGVYAQPEDEDYVRFLQEFEQETKGETPGPVPGSDHDL